MARANSDTATWSRLLLLKTPALKRKFSAENASFKKTCLSRKQSG
jgi:hypothetical protein